MLAAVFVEVAQVNQGVSDLLLSPDFLSYPHGLVEAGQSFVRLAQERIDQGHFVEAGGLTALLTDLLIDGDRFLVVPQGFLRLIHQAIGDSQGLKQQGLLFLVVHLNGEAEAFIQGIEGGLRVVLHDFDAPDLPQRLDVLGIGLQDF